MDESAASSLARATAPRRELKSLTALRGLAAMAVVMQHFSATAQGYCRVIIPSLVPHGYVGVDFFFVLSGFIMAYTYASSFQQRGMAAYGPFLAKRVARIVPLNVVVLCLLAVAGCIGSLADGQNIFQTRHPILDFAANLLMLQGIGIGTNLNGPSWSISTEFAAYAVFPLFAAAIFGRRACFWGVSFVAVAALCILAAGQPRLGMGIEAVPGSLVRCAAEFLLGMAAHRLSLAPRVTMCLRRDAVCAGLALLAVALLAARTDLPAVLLLPFLVICFAANDGRVARVLQWRVFYFLGVVSYAIYLLHNPLRPVGLLLLKAFTDGPVGPAVALGWALAGSFAVVPFAWVAYVCVERPGRAFVSEAFARGGALNRSRMAPAAVRPSSAGGHGRAGAGPAP